MHCDSGNMSVPVLHLAARSTCASYAQLASSVGGELLLVSCKGDCLGFLTTRKKKKKNKKKRKLLEKRATE